MTRRSLWTFSVSHASINTTPSWPHILQPSPLAQQVRNTHVRTQNMHIHARMHIHFVLAMDFLCEPCLNQHTTPSWPHFPQPPPTAGAAGAQYTCTHMQNAHARIHTRMHMHMHIHLRSLWTFFVSRASINTTPWPHIPQPPPAQACHHK